MVAAKSQSDKTDKQAADYIHPLYMNGLHGRMLRMPAPARKRREILFIYGHHSSIERWWGAIQELNRYGAVTVPDLPGFGGMDSFYKIGEKPTIDNFADYLAAFFKMRYKRRRVTIVGLSFGFVVVTRMLQRYPDLAKHVDVLISAGGFAHYEDFTFSKGRHRFYRYMAAFFERPLPAAFFKGVCLNPLVLRAAYHRTHNARRRFETLAPEQHKAMMDFEIYLWHSNELRTYMATANEFLQLNNCDTQVDVPVWHVSIKQDQYFNTDLVEQHLCVIFSHFNHVVADMPAHAPSVIADAKTAAALFPPKIRRVLNSN